MGHGDVGEKKYIYTVYIGERKVVWGGERKVVWGGRKGRMVWERGGGGEERDGDWRSEEEGRRDGGRGEGGEEGGEGKGKGRRGRVDERRFCWF